MYTDVRLYLVYLKNGMLASFRFSRDDVLQMCWVLYCDMICLNYDGNLLDVCTAALLAALRTGESHCHSMSH